VGSLKHCTGGAPIREAIRKLVREGLLETHPTRGTFLRPLTLLPSCNTVHLERRRCHLPRRRRRPDRPASTG
jgi:DNA-binding GntR family transcriptional regulator